jgi:hypothetical protein
MGSAVGILYWTEEILVGSLRENEDLEDVLVPGFLPGVVLESERSRNVAAGCICHQRN